MTNDPDAAKIFRKEALDRVAQQERLDSPVMLSAARPWIAFAALAGIIHGTSRGSGGSGTSREGLV
jgi:uncharacterized membrane protein YccC